MSNKIYVASSLDNAKRISEIVQILKDAGYDITYDWTTHGRVENQEQLQQIAKGEYDGVKDCDVFIMVHPARFGSHFEFGAAYALGKRIMILEESEIEELKSFYFLSGIERFKSIQDILKNINK